MKATLIIGASSGIGDSLARLLVDNNEKVISISRTEPKLNVYKHYSFDVTSSEAFPEIQDEIDGIVYCPGSINLKPFRVLKESDFFSDWQLNVMGAIKSIQAYSKNLQTSQGASIVLFSTLAVQLGMPFHSSVAASKGAIEGLTRALAAELSPKTRVNCIAPSLTNTALAEKLINSPEKLEASVQRHPLKRIGQADDIAQAAQFLLSQQSSWITGQVIHVDGGLSKLKIA